MKTRKLIVVLVVCLVVLGLLPILTMSAHEGGPHIRIAHFVSDAPNVDVYINGELVVKDLAYKNSTNYLAMEGGDFEFVVVPTGKTIQDSITEKPIEMTFKASEGRYFTLAAIGSINDKTFELFRFPADKSAETGATLEATDEDHHDEHEGDDHDDDHHNDATMEATVAQP